MKGPRKYSIEIKASAEKSMLKLPNKAFERIATVILALESDPRPRGCKKLGGRDSFRVRIGNYRVLYTIDDTARIVEIIAVGPRAQIYRRH